MNEWWRGDPTECYWMEITDREDLGADLHAPQVDDAGREYWSYVLVTAVRPRDVVLHWHKSLLGEPAVVAYSTAAYGPMTDEIVWASQGTYGRKRPVMGPEPSWKYPLVGYTPLARPVRQDDFRRAEAELRAIKDELEQRHSGALYFPFAFSDKRPVRAAQGYLVKFPAEVLNVITGLEKVPRCATSSERSNSHLATSVIAAETKRHRTSGYIADVLVRMAIERHAVDWAIAYYSRQGYEVSDVGSIGPYDIRAVHGDEELHVEVKGSSGEAESVELTRNEVDHARSSNTHLVVVDRIEWRRLPDGTIATEGGRVRRWELWSPSDVLLRPTRYRYRLADHMDEIEVP